VTSPPDRLLRRLDWQVVRRLDGRIQGAYRTVFRGTGLDFTDLRAYTPEDDVRHIDWNVTARLDEPYVRVYTEDRDLTAWLVLDLSASMRFGKDSLLTDLATTLGRLFTQGGNRVGAILYDNTFHRVIPPRGGRNHVLYLTHELTKPAPTKADGRTTDLAAMLHLTAATARRRSLIFVISDFITEAGGEQAWESALLRLGQRHEVVTIRVVNPIEYTLPDLGLVLIEDAETGEQLLADTGDPFFQERFRSEVVAREEALAGSMRRAGAMSHRIGTDQDLAQSLIEMAQRTKRRRT
jgi:uncharacterized protein (DUF58 family)